MHSVSGEELSLVLVCSQSRERHSGNCKQRKKGEAPGSSGRQVSVPASVPETIGRVAAGGWAARSALGRFREVLGTRRGPGMSVPCCLVVVGVHEPLWELDVCQLPGPNRDQPCLNPRGREGSKGPIVSLFPSLAMAFCDVSLFDWHPAQLWCT